MVEDEEDVWRAAVNIQIGSEFRTDIVNKSESETTERTKKLVRKERWLLRALGVRRTNIREG